MRSNKQKRKRKNLASGDSYNFFYTFLQCKTRGWSGWGTFKMGIHSNIKFSYCQWLTWKHDFKFVKRFKSIWRVFEAPRGFFAGIDHEKS